MRSLAPLALVLLAAGCGRSGTDTLPAPVGSPGAAASSSAAESGTSTTPRPDLGPEHRLALAEGRCLACHDGAAEDLRGIGPLPAPSLEGLADRVAPLWLVDKLLSHRVGSQDRARDLTAYLLAGSGKGLEPASVGAGRIGQGEQLFAELGCRACHDAGGVAGLETKTDFGSLVAWLGDARSTRPDLAFHDYRLTDGERSALAAWLLRGSLQEAAEAPPTPGLAWECFEVQIETAGRPPLDGVAPSASGTTGTFDVKLGTRGNNFALRFTGGIEIAEAGRYRFLTGSDDSSWLTIDGEEVVRNEGLAPHRRRDGSIELTAGWHDIEVLYTEAGGGESLEVLWQPPGAKQPKVVPPEVLSARSAALVPPDISFDFDEAAVQRGEKAFASARCGACHEAPDRAEPLASPQWADLAFAGDCKVVTATPEMRAARQALALASSSAPSDADQLAFFLQRDRCASCHAREGAGGMRTEAIEALVELEDLGDEGRLPPDLTAIGHHLRPDWTTAFLRGDESARAYVRARCVALEADLAAEYAALFDAVDARDGDADSTTSLDAEVIAEGRRIVGTTGFACIACHQVAGRPSLGPQGMDLTSQGRRLKPAWMREWLGSPATLRPGTRMPTFWADPKDPTAAAQIAAVQAWSALGTAAPLPAGLAVVGGGNVLQVGERPRLHGAFLKDLSAKTLAVGTPERTHYAWDLRHGRLAWLWRGEFLDSAGTWNGRAGQLVEPEDRGDWVVLPEGASFESAGGAPEPAQVNGRMIDSAGYPSIRYRCGEATIVDHPRPRYGASGTELVRRVTVEGGDVVMRLPGADAPRVKATVDGARVTDSLAIPAGTTVEVVYSW